MNNGVDEELADTAARMFGGDWKAALVWCKVPEKSLKKKRKEEYKKERKAAHREKLEPRLREPVYMFRGEYGDEEQPEEE